MSNAQRQGDARPNPLTDFDWEVDETTGGVTIVRFRNRTATEVVIPNEIDGRPVTKIDSLAFWDGFPIRSATLPDGLLNLDKKIFYYCKKLTAFRVSANAKNFRVVDGVLFTVDGKTLVAYPCNKAATEYVVPDGVETVGPRAFAYAQALTSVALPSSLATVGDQAFLGCESLQSIALPQSVATLGAGSFGGCALLR